MNKDLVNEVNSANEEWNGIMQWASKRKELLNYALQKWEEFTQSKKDLLDYLQENDKDLSVWNQIDLNDATSVESKLKLLEVSFFLVKLKFVFTKFIFLAFDISLFSGNSFKFCAFIFKEHHKCHATKKRTCSNF